MKPEQRKNLEKQQLINELKNIESSTRYKIACKNY